MDEGDGDTYLNAADLLEEDPNALYLSAGPSIKRPQNTDPSSKDKGYRFLLKLRMYPCEWAMLRRFLIQWLAIMVML
jgi:hypothetical protein